MFVFVKLTVVVRVKRKGKERKGLLLCLEFGVWSLEFGFIGGERKGEGRGRVRGEG